MTQQELVKFAALINQPVDVARQIVEQESKDKTHHDGRNVRSGYDYDIGRWCDCDYCNQS